MGLKREDVIRNLIDVGLTEEEIERCMISFDESNYQDTYSYLRSVRCGFLDAMHVSQKN